MQKLFFVSTLILMIYGCTDSKPTKVDNRENISIKNTVSDIDGNVYNIVVIGKQFWMKENLKTQHYSNGKPIETGLTDAQWKDDTIGAYSLYSNNSTNDSVFGKLYNWYAVADPRGLCPTGWHVPSDKDWNELIKAIDPTANTFCSACTQSTTAGGAMKEIELVKWASPNFGATNSSGFSGLPGGCRDYDGTYLEIGNQGHWWSATQASTLDAYYFYLDFSNSNINRLNYFKTNGQSVRCVNN
jgi:uncharacterized protein (TIGR02145 family)